MSATAPAQGLMVCMVGGVRVLCVCMCIETDREKKVSRLGGVERKELKSYKNRQTEGCHLAAGKQRQGEKKKWKQQCVHLRYKKKTGKIQRNKKKED